mgnify:CR=1 FL=1
MTCKVSRISTAVRPFAVHRLARQRNRNRVDTGRRFASLCLVDRSSGYGLDARLAVGRGVRWDDAAHVKALARKHNFTIATGGKDSQNGND